MKFGETFHHELKMRQLLLQCTDDVHQQEEIRLAAAQYATHQIRVQLDGTDNREEHRK